MKDKSVLAKIERNLLYSSYPREMDLCTHLMLDTVSGPYENENNDSTSKAKKIWKDKCDIYTFHPWLLMIGIILILLPFSFFFKDKKKKLHRLIG
tara:strand:- start:2986 stop:3270 length:285 start_codon:yes stop_codon:yes gene_type:complete